MEINLYNVIDSTAELCILISRLKEKEKSMYHFSVFQNENDIEVVATPVNSFGQIYTFIIKNSSDVIAVNRIIKCFARLDNMKNTGYYLLDMIAELLSNISCSNINCSIVEPLYSGVRNLLSNIKNRKSVMINDYEYFAPIIIGPLNQKDYLIRIIAEGFFDVVYPDEMNEDNAYLVLKSISLKKYYDKDFGDDYIYYLIKSEIDSIFTEFIFKLEKCIKSINDKDDSSFNNTVIELCLSLYLSKGDLIDIRSLSITSKNDRSFIISIENMNDIIKDWIEVDLSNDLCNWFIEKVSEESGTTVYKLYASKAINYTSSVIEIVNFCRNKLIDWFEPVDEEDKSMQLIESIDCLIRDEKFLK